MWIRTAFIASVEMQRHPELRDKPLAVCGSQEERHGIVLTANYLAKPYGVKTGMAIWQARQKCPNLVILPPDMDEYIRFSRMAREIYEDYTDQIEPFGLDESWLDVTGSVGLFGDPMSIAREISGRIKFELGITASIGVSDNKITAKLGSDYKKPDAITRIVADNYKEIAYPAAGGGSAVCGAGYLPETPGHRDQHHRPPGRVPGRRPGSPAREDGGGAAHLRQRAGCVASPEK